ncbi:MAG: hypothetical protein ACT4R6_10275 [Gemmatimonadaceae bacterium]
MPGVEPIGAGLAAALGEDTRAGREPIAAGLAAALGEDARAGR